MIDKYEKLRLELLEFNKSLKDKYTILNSLNMKEVEEFIGKTIGSRIKLKKADKEKLREYEKSGGVVGVDGSVNKKGGAYPHFIELFQGLALSTRNKDDEVRLTEISSPLLEKYKDNILEDTISSEEETLLRIENRNEILANIEMKVAIESIDKFKPYIILLDGSLLRFHLYSKSLWKEFKDLCVKKNILVIGVIEEIKTQIISKEWNLIFEDKLNAYDKEILFGRLGYGEMLVVRDEVNTKREWTKGGISETIDISSGFIRSSLDPNIIGVDVLSSQKDHLVEMANLIFSLTPENSRGIPYWLDLVDNEVRITSKLMEGLLEQSIDKDLYERLFVETRSKRTL